MPPATDERNDRERLKAIELAVGQIEKQFGKGSIMSASSISSGGSHPRRSKPGSRL